MGKGFKILRVSGIDIKIDFSWIIIALLVTLTLTADPILGALNLTGAQSFLAAAVVAVAFFGCLILHELAHSLVAKRRGIEVSEIRLFFLGGVSNIKKDPRSAFEEFIIAIAGPAMSLLLGGIFMGLFFAFRESVDVLAWGAMVLAFANISLALFNMLPAFPLDGGRVLRSGLWGATKDKVKATKWASNIAQVFSFLAYGLAIWVFLLGSFFTGIMLFILGWYVSRNARVSYVQVLADTYLKNVQVGQVMSRPPEVISPNAPLAQLMYEFFMAKGYQVVPVVEGGYLAGIVTAAQVKALKPEEWNEKRVQDVMTRRGALKVARPEDDLETTVKTGQETAQPVTPVLNSEGYFIGLLTPMDVVRYLQFRQQFGNKGGGFPPYTPNYQPYNNQQPQSQPYPPTNQ